MTVRAALELGLAVTSGAIVVMAIGITAIRAVRAGVERRRARVEARVRPLVLEAMEDPDATLAVSRWRRATAVATATALLPNLRGTDRDQLAAVLHRAGLVAGAYRGLGSVRAARRDRSARLLGLVGDPAAATALAGVLQDRDSAVRAAAARALGRIGSEASVKPLFAALARRHISSNTATMALLRIGSAGIADAIDDPDPAVRSVATELAGSLGLFEAIESAERRLDDPDPRVRASAARTLGRLGDDSTLPALIQALHKALDAPDDDVTVALVVALGQIGDRRAIPALERASTRKRIISHPALTALAAMGADPTDRAGEPLAGRDGHLPREEVPV